MVSVVVDGGVMTSGWMWGTWEDGFTLLRFAGRDNPYARHDLEA